MVEKPSDSFRVHKRRFDPPAPDGRSRGTLSQAIREHLCRRGGVSTRSAIEEDLKSDPVLAHRLREGQGLPRLLRNMSYSGFVNISGETVSATERTMRITLL